MRAVYFALPAGYGVDTKKAKKAPAGSKRKRLPSAAARTISIFTGRSDIDGGELARDGTRPNERPTAKRLGPKWCECGDRWELRLTEKGPTLAVIERKCRAGSYTYTPIVGGKILPSCTSLVDATAAVDRALAVST